MLKATDVRTGHPLIRSRPNPPGPAALPRDEVMLGGHEPLPPSWGWGRTLTVGALGLSAFGCVGAGAPPAPPQQLLQQPEVRPVHRNQNPLSGEQIDRLQELSQAREADGAQAREIRSNYRQQVGHLQRDVNRYLDLSERLQSEGQRLEALAADQNPAVSQQGPTVTEVQHGVTTSVTRQGETWTVTIDDGRRPVTLEDTPGARQIREGMDIFTFHLTDGVLHRAGEFQSQRVTRSYEESRSVLGTRVAHSLDRLVPDEPGRARLTVREVFEEPTAFNLGQDGAQLVYRQDTTRRNLLTQEVTSTSRETAVRADGTTFSDR